MDNTYPPDAWKRLGRLLEQRRGQLGYGFRQREQFLRDRGGPPPSLKMIARLERGERTFYPEATVMLLEALYEYAPGSFEAVLKGGEPAPAAPQPQAPPEPVFGHVPSDKARALFPGDTVKQLIFDAGEAGEDDGLTAELMNVLNEFRSRSKSRMEGTGLPGGHVLLADKIPFSGHAYPHHRAVPGRPSQASGIMNHVRH